MIYIFQVLNNFIYINIYKQKLIKKKKKNHNKGTSEYVYAFKRLLEPII